MTNYVKYALDGYKVGAYRYLLKPVTVAQLRDELSGELARLDRSRSRVVALQGDDGLVSVPLSQVRYFSSDRHLVQAHTARGTLRSTKTIAALESELADSAFFRCHKSFLINLQAVATIGREEVELAEGEKVPVSRHRHAELLDAFATYVGDLL